MKKNKKINRNYENIINKIEKIRSKNNTNWMDLVRLSFSLDPKKSAEILSNIYKEDKKISELTKKLKQ
tara:strand:- start:177 stop:380 length:204 start_codon:yes stop_codon:yes gene_type:complete